MLKYNTIPLKCKIIFTCKPMTYMKYVNTAVVFVCDSYSLRIISENYNFFFRGNRMAKLQVYTGAAYTSTSKSVNVTNLVL